MQPVFPPQRDGPDALLAAVVINFRYAVFKAAPQLRPQAQGITAGFGKGAAGQAIQNVNLLYGLDESTGLRLSGVLV